MTEWVEATEAGYDAMMDSVPPAMWTALGFLVGEAMDHDASGHPRYIAYANVRKPHDEWGTIRFFRSKQPMTPREFSRLTAAEVLKGISDV